MEEKSHQLYIPSNVKTRLEFFKGFGVKELITTIIALIVSLPIAYLIYMISSTMVAIIFLFIVVAGTVVIVTQDDNNLSVAKQIGFMLRYSSMQKKYKYVYYDKWRGKYL